MDKVSQLQEQLNLMSNLYFQSIKTIFEKAPILSPEEIEALQKNQYEKKEPFPETDPLQLKEEVQKLRNDIRKASQDFDKMVDELPGISLTPEDQEKEMKRINDENQKLRLELIKEYEETQKSLNSVSECLRIITQDKFKF